MRGFQPAHARAKAQPFANGGPVRGPGTGTSDDIQTEVPEGTYIMPTDSTQAIGEPVLEKAGAPVARGFAPGGNRKVPVNLSNGEFKLPPEQVHAIGVQALNQMKGATHTPVAARGFAPGARQAGGGEPRMFFADGGVVDEENTQRLAGAPGIGQQPGRPQSAAPATATAPTPAPAAQQTSRGFAVAGAPGVVRTGNSYEAAPAPTPAPAVQQTSRGFAVSGGAATSRDSRVDQIPTGGLKAPAPDGSQNDLLNTDVGRNVKNAMMALPGIGGLARVPSTGGAISSGINAASPGVNAARMMALGSGVAAAGAAPASTTAPGVQAGAGAGRGVVNPPMANPSKPLQQPEPSSTEVMPGVYRNGNSYGDSAGAALGGAQPRGLPTAQNMAAADALAQRSEQESMGRVRGFSPGGMEARGAPGAGGQGYSPASSGNFAWMNDLRDPRSLALRNAGVVSTVHRNQGDAIMANKAAQANVAGVRAAIGTQMHDAQQADTARYQSDNSLAGTQEQADASRYSTDAQAAVAKQRAGWEGAKAGQEMTARGFDIRAAAQQEQLRNQIAQEKDPAKRQSVVQRMREMQGQAQPAEWGVQVTPTTKNVDGSTSMGSIVRYNKATGQTEVVQQPGQGGKADPGKYQQGVVYKDANGQRRQWDGTKFVPV